MKKTNSLFNHIILVIFVVVLASTPFLTSCGGGDDGGTPAGTPAYTIGGTVSGLDGSVVLQSNGGDDLTITSGGGGSFSFATTLVNGSAYAVTVLTQPADQTCSVASGTGTVSGTEVTNITVTCAVNTYTIGGTVSGLSGTGLVLQNIDGDNLSITGNGTFTFATTHENGTAYVVTITNQPDGQVCTIINDASTISGADVTSIEVACLTNYTVGGTVNGLVGSVVLQSNGVDDLTITSDGPFTFATTLVDGSAYAVTVSTQPAGRTCSVAKGTGTVSGSEVTDVTVTCAVNTYTIGGTITGLNGSITLQNNGGDDLILTADGGFTFAAVVADGSAYEVVVKERPVFQNCGVTNATGILSGANITDVTVTCTDKVWIHPAGLADSISPDGQNAIFPRVALDNNGNGVVVWEQFDGTKYQIFKSEYRNGAWVDPTGLADSISPDGQDAYSPQVAMDNNGNTIIVWEQFDGNAGQIFMSEYRNGAWVDPTGLADNISPDGQNTYSPQVAMDNNGNAVVVWAQFDGTKYQIFKSEYRNGAWVDPTGLADSISPDGQDALFPRVAMDDNGNAVVVWLQFDGNAGQIFMSEYRNGAWVDPTGLADSISPDGQDALFPRVAMDNNGNAVVAWAQFDGNAGQIFKSEYRNGAWVDPTGLADSISPDGQNAISPRVATDNKGNAVVVWLQFDGNADQIFKSEYRNGAWVDPTGLADSISPDGQNAYSPRVAMDNNGNAVVAWAQFDGTAGQIFKSEYRNGVWTHPTDLSTDSISPDGQNVYSPQVAMDNNGNAIIVWEQFDGTGTTRQIFKSEFR